MFEEKLLTFFSQRTGVDRSTLDAQMPLFSSGMVDSMAVFELTAFVEREVGVQFSTADISLENLDSVSRILSYVQKRQAG